MPKDADQITEFYDKQVYCSGAKGTAMQSYCSLVCIWLAGTMNLISWIAFEKEPPDLSGTQLANAVSNCKLTDICRVISWLQGASSRKGADS